MKNKYYLAFKNEKWRKLVLPSEKEKKKLEAAGWELRGFAREADIPKNPTLDKGKVKPSAKAKPSKQPKE